MTVESLDQVIMTVLSTSALAACISSGIQMILIYILMMFVYVLCMILRRRRRPVWKRLFIAPLIATIFTFAIGSLIDGMLDVHVAYWISVALSSVIVIHVSKLCDWDCTVENVRSLLYAFRGIKHEKTKKKPTVTEDADTQGGTDSDKPS